MMHSARNASFALAFVASVALSACAGCAPVEDVAPSPRVAEDRGAPAITEAAAPDAGPSDAVYIAPGSLRVRWSFEGAEGSTLAGVCAARGIAQLRIEAGLDGPVTVPCEAGEHRYPSLPAGMYSVTVEPLDASGAPAGSDYYGVVAVRSNESVDFVVGL